MVKCDWKDKCTNKAEWTWSYYCCDDSNCAPDYGSICNDCGKWMWDIFYYTLIPIEKDTEDG